MCKAETMCEPLRATDGRVALDEGEDFYRESAAIVFTARYHLRRGYCCGNGCRHCPFSLDASAARVAGVERGTWEAERGAREEEVEC